MIGVLQGSLPTNFDICRREQPRIRQLTWQALGVTLGPRQNVSEIKVAR